MLQEAQIKKLLLPVLHKKLDLHVYFKLSINCLYNFVECPKQQNLLLNGYNLIA